jgi:hypothetical protein
MRVILHCSDSEFGNVLLIDKWHKARGWRMVGYHLVIPNGYIKKGIFNSLHDGLIESGRPFDMDDHFDPWELGAATKGENDAVQVCLIGKSGQFTGRQLASLEQALREMHSIYNHLDISQHSDHDSKKAHCAGLDHSHMDYLHKYFQ